jgi:hypothetical protein
LPSDLYTARVDIVVVVIGGGGGGGGAASFPRYYFSRFPRVSRTLQTRPNPKPPENLLLFSLIDLHVVL